MHTQKMAEKSHPENDRKSTARIQKNGKCTTWKKTTWKKHDMENDRMEIVHLEKGRICHHLKMKENAPMENVQHRKCTPRKR